MEYTEWLENLTTDSQNEIAEKIGISRRTLQNQIYGTPKMETVVKIAEAYGLNPHVALSDLGYIDTQWLDALVGDIDAALLAADEPRLADEVLRRMMKGAKTDEFTTPVDALAERHLRVADSSPDEDALRGYDDDDDHLP